MARSKDKDAVAVGMGMEATQGFRSIHPQDMCSLAFDMLKFVDMDGKELRLALHLH